jgi:hypothetical protein
MTTLAELKAEAARLSARIAKLEAGGKADLDAMPQSLAFEQVSSPVKQREVSITEVHTERSDGPNLAELKKLYAVVKSLIPEQKSHDPDAGFRGFCGAYRFVSNCPRLPAPNGRVALSWWQEGMTAWLRARGAMTNDVTGASFVAAVMASGDIAFSPHNGDLGHVWEFAILSPGQSGGKPASDAWKRILREGAAAVLPPSAPARRAPAPSQVRIYGG